MNPFVGETKVPLIDAKIVAKNVSNDVYFRQEAQRGDPRFVMSRGELMEFNRCPQRWLRGYESEESKATEWGSLIDCLALQESEFAGRFAVAPETYVNDKGEEKPWNWNANVCKEWREDQIGKEIVKSEKLTEAKNAVKMLYGNPTIAELLRCSEKQVMAIATYEDEETGISVPLKVLLDLVPKGETYGKCLGDLKTATSAHPAVWARAVNEHNYHVQAAMYLDVYKAATGEDRTDWLHVVQESYPPWQAATWLLSSEFVELGRMKYLNALGKYCRCLKAGQWPGYESTAITWGDWGIISPESWMV